MNNTCDDMQMKDEKLAVQHDKLSIDSQYGFSSDKVTASKDEIHSDIPSIYAEPVKVKVNTNTIFNTKNLNVVEQPEHYGAQSGGVQCIEAMLQTFGKEATMAFCKLNAFKYIWRSPHKDKEVQDMQKAQRYLMYWHVLDMLEGDIDDGSFHKCLYS